MDKNYLPYFKIKKKSNYFTLYRFLLRKFRPSLRKKFPHHYLISQDPRLYLQFIKQISKTHPHFLRFDITKYFPSINHQILISEISSNYQHLTGKTVSRRFKGILKKDLPQFLQSSPYLYQGLPIGTPLSYILAGIYLLKLDLSLLDLSLPVPFLRFNDDYLLFCKTKGQAEELLKNIIVPVLNELGLSINFRKLKSGKFHQDKVNFLGFEFYAGYIRISGEKIEGFKQRIKKLTYLTRKKSVPAVIKLLNNQILGFGHYYKLAQTKQIFEELDAFIRSRLRRYIQRNKDNKDKQGNLILTNASLKSLGLKSLKDIYQKYWQKNHYKFRKKAKSKAGTGKLKRRLPEPELEEIELKYQHKLILNQLKELTSLVKKLERRITNLERKRVKKNGSNS